MTHDGQCIHTFEITCKACLLCAGHNKTCRDYEPRSEKPEAEKKREAP